MKPTRDTFQVEGNIAGERTAMTIDQSAMEHIMAVLTDLYSDPEAAVLREYATNAIDSHVEAGNTAPIEVDLPGALSPYLTIRDFGVGLSVEEVHNIYSKYGCSTKRDTNEQAGMLGLGCKSGLTYASQFTLTAVKDGVRCRVSVSREDTGGASLTVVDTERTSAADGVEVKIPVRQGNAIAGKAGEFFRFWPEGSVKVNGIEPTHHGGLKLSESLYVTENSDPTYRYSRDRATKLVMGNVSYPVDWAKAGLEAPSVGLIAYVPIGSVHFTPSREALHYTPTTKAALRQVLEDFEAGCAAAVQREIDSAADHAEALAKLVEWEYLLPSSQRSSLKYKGGAIPEEYRSSLIQTANGFSGGYKSKRGGSSSISAVLVKHWPVTLWIEDFTLSTWTADHSKKAEKWCEENGVENVQQVILLPRKAPQSPYIDTARVLPYETLRQVKLPRIVTTPGGPARPVGSYDLYTFGLSNSDDGSHAGVPGDQIDLTKPIYWIHGNMFGARSRFNTLAKFYPRFTLVCLPGGRIDKFCRIVPKAKHAPVALKEAQDRWEAKLTADQKLALAIYDSGEQRVLQAIDQRRVDDPDLQNAARLAMMDVTKLVDERRSFDRYYKPTTTFQNPLTKYPLADFGYGRRSGGADHVYDYVNWHYANLKTGGTV